MAWPSGQSSATSSGNHVQLSHIYFGTPPWPTTKWRFLFFNGWLNGASATEHANTNVLPLDYATLFDSLSNTASLKWGAATTVTLPKGAAYWTDDCAMSFPANSFGYVRTALNVAVGDRYPTGYFPSLVGSDLGEGRGSYSASQPSLQFGGALNGTAGNSLSFGPAAAVCDGWDGVTPVFLIFGTSRAQGQNEYDYKLAARGCTGALARALDDSASGRMAFNNWSAQGADIRQMLANNNFAKRFQALRALPNCPFNRIITDLNVNDINNDASGPQTLADVQALHARLYAYLNSLFPGLKVYHAFGEPWANTTLNNTKWDTLADQVPLSPSAIYPTGLQFLTNAWLASDVGLPSNVEPIDLSSAYQDPSTHDHWPVPGITGTLQTTIASGGASITTGIVVNLSSAPSPGDSLVLDTGLGTVETILISKVTDLGGGQYNLQTVSSLTAGHTAGNACGIAYVRDGVHEGSTLAKDAAAQVDTAKTGGTIN